MLKKALTLSALCALLCTALLLSSCANSQNDNIPDDTTPPAADIHNTTPTDTTADPGPDYSDKLVIVLDGKANYSIIRADNAQDRIVKAGAALLTGIKQATSTTIPLGTDWVKDPSTIDQSAPEIIVGETNRTASIGVADTLEPRTFIIKAVGDQIIITGTSDKLTAHAVDYFVSEYINNPEYLQNGNLMLPRDLYDVQGPFDFEMTDLINKDDEYTTTYTKLFDIKNVDGYRIMQGGCTDGKYCYFAMENQTFPEGSHKSYIYKYDANTWELVARSEGLPLDHSNDICYNPDTKELIVVHNAPNRDTLSIVDPDTLTVKETFKIKYKIFSMAYNQSRQQYVIGLSGGQNFALLDTDFKAVKNYTVNSTGYTTQGVECDNDFIYFVQYNQNVIMIYDWSGKLVKRVDMTLLGIEPENICLIEGEFIIGCNNANWTGGEVYSLEIIKKN